MGEVWFEVSEEPCGTVFVLTYYFKWQEIFNYSFVR